VLFMAIKGINKLQTQEAPKPPGPTPEVKLLTEAAAEVVAGTAVEPHGS
jgi:hypothetical protein